MKKSKVDKGRSGQSECDVTKLVYFWIEVQFTIYDFKQLASGEWVSVIIEGVIHHYVDSLGMLFHSNEQYAFQWREFSFEKGIIFKYVAIA